MKTISLLLLLALPFTGHSRTSFHKERVLPFSHQEQLRNQMIKTPDQFAPELIKNESAPFRLDSLVKLDMGVKKGHVTYDYDDQQHLTATYHYSETPDKKYTLFRKDKYTYNEDGSLAEWQEYSIQGNSETKVEYKLYDYPDGGKRVRTFYASGDGFKELECDWVDKHGLRLLNLMFCQKGSVDEKNHIHILDCYNGSDLDPNDKYRTDTTYYDENWNMIRKRADVYYTKDQTQNAVPGNLYVTFYNENMEYRCREESYTFNPESKSWTGDYAEQKTYYPKEGTELFHQGQVKEKINFKFINNGWQASYHEKRDKLNNILFKSSDNGSTEFVYDYRILPDGMRVTEQSPGIEFSSEIIHLDEHGYPSSFTQGRNEYPFERKEEILANGYKQIEFSCQTLMDNVRILRTLTFILDPDSKVVSFIPKLYGPYADDFYKYSREYTYNKDTICVKTYETSPDVPECITRFGQDHFIYSTCKFDYTNSDKADYYKYDTYERENNDCLYLINYGEYPKKFQVKYNKGGKCVFLEEYSGNKGLHPSHPDFWVMNYTTSLDYNEAGLMTKNYYSPREGVASLSEKEYHSLYPTLLIEESEKQWNNHQMSKNKQTLYHYSDWTTVSEGSISVEAAIKFVRQTDKVILIHPSYDAGNWILYSPDGSCMDRGCLNPGQTEIPIIRLNSGIYILRIYTENSQETIKFIR
ncbi:MAG: T9SS type A sorting domain-containing protein [Bacteroidales bacterium]